MHVPGVAWERFICPTCFNYCGDEDAMRENDSNPQMPQIMNLGDSVAWCEHLHALEENAAQENQVNENR